MTPLFKKSVLCEFTTEELKQEILARGNYTIQDLNNEFLSESKSMTKVESKAMADNFWRQFADKPLNINGITAADFEVGIEESPFDENSFCYTFNIIKDSEPHDIYYSEEIEKDWWPKIDGENAAFNFVPEFLSEACENYYDSRFDKEKTLELLKKLGFNKFIDYEYTDD